MKKWIIISLIMMMCFGFSADVFADEGGDPTDTNDYSWELDGLDGSPSLERWSYTSFTSQGISVKNGQATVTASVTGYSNKATKVVMYMYLQQSTSSGGWTNLDSWGHTFNKSYGAAEHTYSPCATGHKYRLRCSYYVYSGDKYEHIIAYSSEKSY